MPDSLPFPPQAEACLQQGRYIDAVRTVRRVRGCGLTEAKQAVQAYISANPEVAARMAKVDAKNRKILLAIIAAMAAAAFFVNYFRLAAR